MKTFIINLASSTGRRATISAQCDAAGLDYEFISAVKLLAVHPAPVLLHDLAQQTSIQHFNDIAQHNQQKRDIWAGLMARRPLRVRLRHRYRRAVLPLLHRIVDVNTGAVCQE